MIKAIVDFRVQNLKINTSRQIPLSKILIQVTIKHSEAGDHSNTNKSAFEQGLFIYVSESESKNSDVINITIEQFLPSFGITEIIFFSDNELQVERKY